jgi:hypothetical protein
MKDAPEAEESLEVDVEDSDNIFDTPSLRWLQKKKSFLMKARDYQFWGRQGSKQRVTAMDSFRKYCMQSLDMTADSPGLWMDVFFDMQNIIHEQRLLPMPNYVRRKLVYVSKEDEHDPELQMSRVTRELDNLCDDALAHYEKSEWSKLQKIEEDACQLRALRKCIYDRGQKYNEANGTGDDGITSLTCEYDFEVRNFLRNYEEILSTREVTIWKEKLKETVSFVTSQHQIGQFFDDAKGRKSLEISEAEKQELLVDNLPSVPQNEFFDPIDLEIETRLNEIKFFANPGTQRSSMILTPWMRAHLLRLPVENLKEKRLMRETLLTRLFTVVKKISRPSTLGMMTRSTQRKPLRSQNLRISPAPLNFRPFLNLVSPLVPSLPNPLPARWMW